MKFKFGKRFFKTPKFDIPVFKQKMDVGMDMNFKANQFGNAFMFEKSKNFAQVEFISEETQETINGLMGEQDKENKRKEEQEKRKKEQEKRKKEQEEKIKQERKIAAKSVMKKSHNKVLITPDTTTENTNRDEKILDVIRNPGQFSGVKAIIAIKKQKNIQKTKEQRFYQNILILHKLDGVKRYSKEYYNKNHYLPSYNPNKVYDKQQNLKKHTEEFNQCMNQVWTFTDNAKTTHHDGMIMFFEDLKKNKIDYLEMITNVTERIKEEEKDKDKKKSTRRFNDDFLNLSTDSKLIKEAVTDEKSDYNTKETKEWSNHYDSVLKKGGMGLLKLFTGNFIGAFTSFDQITEIPIKQASIFKTQLEAMSFALDQYESDRQDGFDRMTILKRKAESLNQSETSKQKQRTISTLSKVEIFELQAKQNLSNYVAFLLSNHDFINTNAILQHVFLDKDGAVNKDAIDMLLTRELSAAIMPHIERLRRWNGNDYLLSELKAESINPDKVNAPEPFNTLEELLSDENKSEEEVVSEIEYTIACMPSDKRIKRDEQSGYNTLLHKLIKTYLEMNIPSENPSEEQTIKRLKYEAGIKAYLNSLTPEELNRLLNQKNKDGDTPMSLFYKKGKSGTEGFAFTPQANLLFNNVLSEKIVQLAPYAAEYRSKPWYSRLVAFVLPHSVFAFTGHIIGAYVKDENLKLGGNVAGLVMSIAVSGSRAKRYYATEKKKQKAENKGLDKLTKINLPGTILIGTYAENFWFNILKPETIFDEDIKAIKSSSSTPTDRELVDNQAIYTLQNFKDHLAALNKLEELTTEKLYNFNKLLKHRYMLLEAKIQSISSPQGIMGWSISSLMIHFFYKSQRASLIEIQTEVKKAIDHMVYKINEQVVAGTDANDMKKFNHMLEKLIKLDDNALLYALRDKNQLPYKQFVTFCTFITEDLISVKTEKAMKVKNLLDKLSQNKQYRKPNEESLEKVNNALQDLNIYLSLPTFNLENVEKHEYLGNLAQKNTKKFTEVKDKFIKGLQATKNTLMKKQTVCEEAHDNAGLLAINAQIREIDTKINNIKKQEKVGLTFEQMKDLRRIMISSLTDEKKAPELKNNKETFNNFITDKFCKFARMGGYTVRASTVSDTFSSIGSGAKAGGWFAIEVTGAVIANFGDKIFNIATKII